MNPAGRSPSIVASGVIIIGPAATVSLFWLLVFYPGPMVIDGLLHWWGQAVQGRFSTWHPPVLAMLLRATLTVTDQPALFCFLQGTFFWSSLFFLLRLASPSVPSFLAAVAVIACVPALWMASSAMSSNAWMAGFGFLCIGGVIQAVRSADSRWFWAAVLALAGAIMFRREAIIFLPVLALIFYRHLGKPSNPAKIAGHLSLTCVLAVTPALAIEFVPSVEATPNFPAGHHLLNHYVGTIKHTHMPKSDTRLKAERADIDSEFGDGTFEKLLQRYGCGNATYITYEARQYDKYLGNSSVIPGGIKWHQVPYIINKLAEAALRYPQAFIQHNACYFGRLLKINGSGYHSFANLADNLVIDLLRLEHGIEFSSRLPTVKNWYRKAVTGSLSRSFTSWLYAHWWLWITACVAWIWGAIRGRPELWVPGLFGAIYPLAFFLIGGATGWRYLLFTHVCGWVCILIGIQRSLTVLGTRIRRNQNVA